MSPRLVFIPLLLASLAACGTPQEQCIRRETAELRKVERLLADTQGNLARGYGYETDTITTHQWVACIAPGSGVVGRPVRTTMCFEPQTETIRREVPLAIGATVPRRMPTRMPTPAQRYIHTVTPPTNGVTPSGGNTATTATADTAPPSPLRGPLPSGCDPRERLDVANATMIDVVRGIAEGHYDLSTPCDLMSVAELAGHVVMAMRRIACAGRAVPVQDWPVDAADVGVGEWVDALVDARADASAAWADDSLLERPTALPWGTFPGAEVLDVYTNEMTMHAWDLAVATGQQPEWDDTVVAAALEVARQMLPAENRRALYEEISAARGLNEVGVPFAEAVPIPDDAPAIDRLVAWNGRDPSYAPT